MENLALHIGTESTNQHDGSAALWPLCERWGAAIVLTVAIR